MSRNKNSRANERTKTETKTKNKKQVRKRNRMESAIYIVGIAATVFCLLAGYFASVHNNLKSQSI
jgi:cell division protein FtsL